MYKNHKHRLLAIGLENYPNTAGVTVAYPSKSIRDNNGTNNGTPFNALVYQDMHQVLAKLLRRSGIAPNALPENETNGFQYLDAMERIMSDPGMIIPFDRSASQVFGSEFRPLIEILIGSPNTGDILLGSCAGEPYDFRCITVVNNSAFACDIFPNGTDTVGGNASKSLVAGTSCKLILNKHKNDWKVIDF